MKTTVLQDDWRPEGKKYGARGPLSRWVLGLLLASLAWLGAARVSGTDEERLFDAAAQVFNDGFYERADREFGEFARMYPYSGKWAESILYQAQARFKLHLFDATLEVLNANIGGAGSLADQYRFWMAEAWFYRTNYASASVMYAQLLKDFPESPLGPNAAWGQAYAWFQLGNLTNVLTLLRQPEGTFQRLARRQPTNEFVLRGHLLLADVLIEMHDLSAAEQGLNALPADNLKPELEWQRQALWIRCKLQGQQPDAALEHVTNLFHLAENSDLRRRKPEAVALQGEVLKQGGQILPAVAAYQQNLAGDVPPEYRQQALISITDLYLRAQQPAQAAAALSQLIEQFPNDPAQTRWRLNLGELFLQQYRLLQSQDLGSSPTNRWLTASNLLQQAQVQFDQLITQFTNSPVLGQAHLDRGWCFWEAGRLAESQADFQTATRLLPSGEARAWAQFKWADTQYRLGDLNAAATNYQQLVSLLVRNAPAQTQLVQQAFYQWVRVSVDLQDLPVASRTMRELLNLYPTNAYADRVLLLVGQLHNRQGKPAAARDLLNELLKRFPQSPLIPEARMAVARTYTQESNWPAALEEYEQWILTFTKHPALPQVEFYRAWTYDQNGQSTNALVLFTNFVARFSRPPIVPQATNWIPLAQNWIGDYYYNLGQYPKAEENYQILYQQWPDSELNYRARIKAGQAAFLRQGFDHAIGYFTNLINDARCPPTLVAEAFFNLGEVLMCKPATNLLSQYEPAIVAYAKIPQSYPTNRLTPLAWGKIGECYLQLAAQDTNQYANASQYFQQVLKSPLADWTARCQAEVGLAIVNEKLAQLRSGSEQVALLVAARDHYLNVIYDEKTRRPEEALSPFWLEKAGLEAARLAESQQQWAEAARIYERIEKLLPALQPALTRKREAALKLANGGLP
jgi:tetratricopeptide (TPR) repeat protein